IEPFIFNSVTENEPTTFNINFIVFLKIEENTEAKPVRVEYGFSADKNIIFEEWLSVYPKGREQSWFHRQYNKKTQSYDWSNESPFFKGKKSVWKQNTRPDQLFLSTAVQLNSEQLKPIYEWFSNQLRIVARDRIDSLLTIKMCEHNQNLKKIIISLLNQADIDVDDIDLRDSEFDFDSLPKDLPESIKNKIREDFKDRKDAYFVHTNELGKPKPLPLDEESDGTQKIFEFSSLIFVALSQGPTLIIDELNKSLHPHLVRFLIRIFNSEINEKHAQLIITTHETSALRKDLLRRDQSWLCEKQSEKTTRR
ncbi:ATP-binding protein, partial [Acinetobacter baumannii]|nr:ATP-binding protein [Acinetobacter baumannii]